MCIRDSTLPVLHNPAISTEIAELARAYKRANGPVMSLVNRLGGGMEKQMDLLPARLRVEIDRVTCLLYTSRETDAPHLRNSLHG